MTISEMFEMQMIQPEGNRSINRVIENHTLFLLRFLQISIFCGIKLQDTCFCSHGGGKHVHRD